MRSTSTRPTRREFLRAAGAAVAVPYVITSSALGAAGRSPASDRIVTALIGSGARGNQIIVGGDKVVAVCDVDSAHLAKSKAAIDKRTGNEDCATYADFREVLARDDIDAVVVATPDHWHVPIAAAAIKAGKHVYVEKPLSLTIHEGRVLADLARQYNAFVQVGSQQRSPEFSTFPKAFELVRNGRIGKLESVRVEIVTRPGSAEPWKPQPVPKELNYDFWLGQAPWSPYHADRVHYNFRFVSDCSGGDLTNWGAHHLDFTQWVLDADASGPVSVEGRGKHNTTGLHDSFYDIAVDFTYANGVKVQLVSGDDSGTGQVRLKGSEGSIVVSRERIDAEPRTLLDWRIGANDVHAFPEGSNPAHMSNWLDCVRARNGRGLYATAEAGHRSATVCHLANIAMQLRRKLAWDPAAERFVDDDEANRLLSRPMRQPWTL